MECNHLLLIGVAVGYKSLGFNLKKTQTVPLFLRALWKCLGSHGCESLGSNPSEADCWVQLSPSKKCNHLLLRSMIIFCCRNTINFCCRTKSNLIVGSAIMFLFIRVQLLSVMKVQLPLNKKNANHLYVIDCFVLHSQKCLGYKSLGSNPIIILLNAKCIHLFEKVLWFI